MFIFVYFFVQFINEQDAKIVYDKYKFICQNEFNKSMTESELHNVCVNVWNFYNEEILFLFRSLKYILTAAENQSSHYSVCILSIYIIIICF